MEKPKDQNPISDNPSTKAIKTLLPAIKAIGSVAGTLGKLGIKREAFTTFKSQVDDIAQQATIFDLPDRFNAAFGNKGWVTVGSAISVDVMNSALKLHDAGKSDEAEQELVEWFTKENIELFAITRARRFHQAMLRDDQLREALSLYLEKRYMAAVPLVLIACDGFASDVSGISPFAEGADLTAFDSVIGHPTGLRAKTLRETVEGELDLLVIRYTDSGDVAMSNDDNCGWTVQQLCIYDVMNGQFIDEDG